MFKQDFLEVKISNTCTLRAVCRYCGGNPVKFYYVRTGRLYKNHRTALDQFKYIRDNVKRLCTDSYVEIEAKDMTMSSLKYPVGFKGYSPKLHRTRGSSNSSNYSEVLTCECMKTSWNFNYSSTNERKEITMRQGIKRYNKKFTYGSY